MNRKTLEHLAWLGTNALLLSSFLVGCTKGLSLPGATQSGSLPAGTALLTISDGSSYDYGIQFIDATAEHTFTVTNNGTGTASNMSSSLYVSVFQFTGGTYPGVGGTCGVTLAAGASCTMAVTYDALYASDLTAPLNVTYNNGSSNQTAIGPLLQGTAMYSASGTVDTTFNGTGEVITPILTSNAQAHAIVQQPNSQMIVAGYAFNGNNNEFVVARYNYDGTLDSTFGGNGYVVTQVGVGDGFVSSAAIQSDGSIFAAGWAQGSTGGAFEFAVVKYRNNGTLDTTFGTNGIVLIPIGTGNSYATGVAVQSTDLRIVVAGYTTNTSNHGFVILRLNTNGTLDPLFGTSGISLPAIGNDDYARALVIQPDGNILVAGTSLISTNDFALARLLPSGSFDTSFGTNGVVTTDIGVGTADQAWSMALQSDGMILVGGSSSDGGGPKEFAMTRYTGTGVLDTGFGATGRLVTSIGTGDAEIEALAIQTNGSIIAAGYQTSGTETNFAAIRVTTNGTIDPTFSTAGNVIVSFGPGTNIAYGVTIMSNGKIVLAGDMNNGTNYGFALTRIWP